MDNTMDSPELLDAFRSAAVSVTSLFKAALGAQSRTHAEGYQEALRDLIGFLDAENLGLGDGEGWRVRSWATEKMNGFPPPAAGPADTALVSEEENEADNKPESCPSPVERMDTQPAIGMPTQEQFTFTSGMAYPEPNLETLNISEAATPTQAHHMSRVGRARHAARGGARGVGKPVAGQKRKLNIAELFSLDSLGPGKDIFGSGRDKRRHIGGSRDGS